LTVFCGAVREACDPVYEGKESVRIPTLTLLAFAW